VTVSSPPPEALRTIPDAVERLSDRRDEETFLRYGDRSVSFGRLDRRSSAVADALRAEGVQPGDHVCLFLYNSPAYVYTFLALSKLGAVAAPIDTRFTGDTLAYVLSETDADVLFLDARTREAYEAVRSNVPNVTTEFFVGSADRSHGYRSFEELLSGDPGFEPDTSVSETDTASVTYVQRHAAERPKGVLLPQYSYVNTGWEVGRNLFGFSTDDRIFTTLPLYSIFTFQLGIMGTLLAEAEFVLAEQFDPDHFWDQIAATDATVFLYLSRMLSVLYNQEAGPPGETTCAEWAIGHGFGFDTDEDLIRNFEDRFDLTVLEGYGVTEVATIATYNTSGNRKPGSVGTPVAHAEVRVVDDDDRPVPAGETGEIVVRPTRPNTMLQGYYGEPEHTVDVCTNQWIHTGDIGYLDDDGFVYFVANRDNSIYRGRIAGRISSLEIESVIDAQPGVAESAVVGVSPESGREAIKAVVVPADGVDLNPVDISRHCEQQLPYLKVPRYVTVREELPRNPSGKICKDDLRDDGVREAWDRESGYELSR
jgi:acyl-CoA synthetase (AMP-forming)/AMP-acid ligase II